MPIDDLLLAALVERFVDRGLRVGTPPEPLAVFPAKHAEVGDVSVWRPQIVASSIGQIVQARVAIGGIISDEFQNFDSHLDTRQRAERLTQDVVRFLHELFADRLLFWTSTDGGNRGWRECPAGCTEPLVLDDRTYRTYLWSGPLAEWRATPSILARGRLRDEREYQILLMRLDATGPSGLERAERDLAIQLIADYEGGHAV